MTFPTGVYRIEDDFYPAASSISFGPALSGFVQSQSGPDQPWACRSTVRVPFVAQASWRAFISARRGRENTFVHKPMDSDGFPPGTVMTVKDGATTITDPLGTALLTATVTKAAGTYAKKITLTHAGEASNWAVGDKFRIRGTMHEAVDVKVVDADTVIVEVVPRIRRPISAGDVVGFPACRMLLASADSGRLALTGAGSQDVQIELTEIPE